MQNGIKKTDHGYLINLDNYYGRDRWDTGTICGKILRLTVDAYDAYIASYETKKYNNFYSTEFDAVLASNRAGTEFPRGVSIYRTGILVQ